jgi:uncharacterized protein (DUF362 family)
MVRVALYGLGLDKDNYGKNNWNPIGSMLKPGAHILIKPNFVTHLIPPSGVFDCVVTHPSIIRCIIDYCIIAKAGIIEVGDAPVQGCDLPLLLERHGYNRMLDFFNNHGKNIVITDFRRTVSKNLWPGVLLQTRKQKTFNDAVEFDLGNLSYFF